jgi:prepilin-type processing-associated H-X9-DG protein
MRAQVPENASPSYFWTYFILPYMEQQNVYALIPTPLATAPDWTSGNYATVAQTQVSMLRCPSSTDQLTYSSQGIGSRFAISYAANQTGNVGPDAQTGGSGEWGAHMDDNIGGTNGTFTIAPNNNLYRYDGAFGFNTKTRMTSITDGTSNTLGVAERYRVSESYDTYTTSAGTGAGGTWGMGTPSNNNAVQQSVGSTAVPFNYNVTSDNTSLSRTSLAYSSRHTGGVNAMFMDGSVRFLTNSTPGAVRSYLGTIAGGEVLGNF